MQVGPLELLQVELLNDLHLLDKELLLVLPDEFLLFFSDSRALYALQPLLKSQQGLTFAQGSIERSFRGLKRLLKVLDVRVQFFLLQLCVEPRDDLLLDLSRLVDVSPPLKLVIKVKFLLNLPSKVDIDNYPTDHDEGT